MIQVFEGEWYFDGFFVEVGNFYIGFEGGCLCDVEFFCYDGFLGGWVVVNWVVIESDGQGLGYDFVGVQGWGVVD